MEMQVKLETHRGTIDHPELGKIEQELPQFRVFALVGDPQRQVCYGYVGKDKGRAFCPTPNFVDLPKEYQDAIYAGVCREIGEQRPLGIMPLSVSVLTEIEAMESGIVEEDEDE